MDGMLVHRRITPGIMFTVTHSYLYLGGERYHDPRVTCLAHDKSNVPARARARTARSGDEYEGLYWGQGDTNVSCQLKFWPFVS